MKGYRKCYRMYYTLLWKVHRIRSKDISLSIRTKIYQYYAGHDIAKVISLVLKLIKKETKKMKISMLIMSSPSIKFPNSRKIRDSTILPNQSNRQRVHQLVHKGLIPIQ